MGRMLPLMRASRESPAASPVVSSELCKVNEVSPVTPIAIVRENGTLEELGRWIGAERVLELERPGYPFLGVGRHSVEGELPWLFWDMCPSGFLGRRFAQLFPELHLPDRDALWSAEHSLRALSQRGEDLSGNLIIGAESRARFERDFVPAIRSGALKRSDHATVVEEFLSNATSAASSSLGGARPKLVLHSVGSIAPRDMLLKFTPPLDTELGRRWNQLLLLESLCARTLSQHGIAAVGASPETYQLLPGGRRGGLLLPRFDREPTLGRQGASTLYWLALSRNEFEKAAPEVMRSLATDGLVSDEDARTVSLVHQFSAAIGNNDAHLGNYGLVFDALGNASLAPIFDVTAMVFAPLAEELPDSRVAPRTGAIPEPVEPLVQTLVSLVEAEPRIDPAFRSLWLRYVGA